MRSADDDANTPYGFTWGPLEVTRLAEIQGRVVLEVKTDHHVLEIAVSPQGRVMKVYKNHEELS